MYDFFLQILKDRNTAAQAKGNTHVGAAHPLPNVCPYAVHPCWCEIVNCRLLSTFDCLQGPLFNF